MQKIAGLLVVMMNVKISYNTFIKNVSASISKGIYSIYLFHFIGIAIGASLSTYLLHETLKIEGNISLISYAIIKITSIIFGFLIGQIIYKYIENKLPSYFLYISNLKSKLIPYNNRL